MDCSHSNIQLHRRTLQVRAVFGDELYVKPPNWPAKPLPPLVVLASFRCTKKTLRANCQNGLHLLFAENPPYSCKCQVASALRSLVAFVLFTPPLQVLLPIGRHNFPLSTSELEFRFVMASPYLSPAPWGGLLDGSGAFNEPQSGNWQLATGAVITTISLNCPGPIQSALSQMKTVCELIMSTCHSLTGLSPRRIYGF